MELWITKHGGKMKGIDSISTNCMLNPNCTERQGNEALVCSKCYSKKYLMLRPALRERLTENTGLLTNGIIDENDLPIINRAVFRLESFGDLINTTQMINYINLCYKNSQTTFALWTKNTHILYDIFETRMIEKPDNLIINFSSPILNMPITSDIPKYIDHVFTVYEKKYLKDHDVNVNCGAKNCLKCKICYTKGTDYFVNEILK